MSIIKCLIKRFSTRLVFIGDRTCTSPYTMMYAEGPDGHPAEQRRPRMPDSKPDVVILLQYIISFLCLWSDIGWAKLHQGSAGGTDGHRRGAKTVIDALLEAAKRTVHFDMSCFHYKMSGFFMISFSLCVSWSRGPDQTWTSTRTRGARVSRDVIVP
jgi:hypothetical protein